jgi:hypothetical protein
MVVAGVSTVGAALFAGFFLGGPSLANLFPTLTQLTALTVALAAIGVGRNPNGFITTYLRPQWEAVARSPRLLAGVLVGVAALYALRVGGVLDNWNWVVLTLLVIVPAPLIAHLTRARHGTTSPGPPRVEDLGPVGGRAQADRPVEVPPVPHGRP